MATISIDVPTQYVSRVLEAIKGKYPIPQDKNPEFDDPGSWPDPSNPPPEYINRYTDAQWAKIKIRDFLVGVVRRYEEEQAILTAKASINIPNEIIGT